MSIRSGTVCTCGFCGYVGPCYGIPVVPPGSVSAPWCPRCGLNNKLVPQTANSGAGANSTQQALPVTEERQQA